MKVIWSNEIDNLRLKRDNGQTLESIGSDYGVSKQRMYQVFTKFGIETPVRERKNFLRNLAPKYYWFNRIMTLKQIPKADRIPLLSSFPVPDVCPILGLELNYLGTGEYSADNSPSLDQIIPGKGYTKDNIQIISWRANRIKNDGTPEELIKIGEYLLNLTKKDLQL